jgi:YgiT-type zinc finger domain-containing protein
MSNNETPQQSSYPCNECPAGVMHLDYITYFTWLGEELITVQNFPAWVCDVCGKREYDAHAVNWLTTFLSPNAGQAAKTRNPKRLPAKKQSPSRPAPEH